MEGLVKASAVVSLLLVWTKFKWVRSSKRRWRETLNVMIVTLHLHTPSMSDACVDKSATGGGQILSVSFCRFTPTVFIKSAKFTCSVQMGRNYKMLFKLKTNQTNIK